MQSLPAAFLKQVELSAIHPAQWVRRDGDYIPITYEMLSKRIQHVASGLMRAGVKPGDRIGIVMENRPEWAVIDYAILSIGAVTVPLYCSYRPQDMAYVLDDCSATIVFTSGGELLRHLKMAIESCKTVKRIYVVDEPGDNELVANLSEIETCEVDEERLMGRVSKIDRDQLASLVYTSGTTANPKGVMLSHGNFLTNLEAVPAVIDLLPDEKMLSFLPLAHVLERTGSHFLAYTFGVSVAFAERPDTVAKNMTEAQPTMMIAVPRMLEVVRSRILAQVAKQSALKQKLFHLYFRLAGEGHSGVFTGLMFKVLNKMVGEKIRDRFGGRLRALVSGGAPLGKDVGLFFETVGLPVLEGYGLSESSPLLAVNPMHDRRIGTVGPAAKGVEIKIADDGEILARGGNIMSGYWKNRKATQEALVDGWLHTGDIGELDEDGYLRITDRKKDIIVNSGGENIAPQRVEAPLVVEPLIDQVVVYGDQRPYLVAMVVPNREACSAWANEQGLPKSGWEELASSDVLRKLIQNRIQQHLKSLNSFEQIRRIHIQTNPFTVENGFLTPTMKLKRKNIYHEFAEIFEALY
ncbi:MAG TPA: long-chain fatty acid--CoA ligase [Mariprofundaceae bacterium]|nr:long-chain fatty acid--CoA ligase [Mariprofundaceae bacterium]